MTIRPLKSSTATDWRLDWPAKVLTAACVLNLNGVFSMMFDVGQAISLVMLGTSVILIAGTGRHAWSLPFALLVAAIVSYLILGALFYDPAMSVEPASKYLQSYFNSVLIIWALAGYVASLKVGPRLISFLRFLRNVFLISAASVWASPILYGYYVNLPFSFEQRMGGFFGNPNEAAMASVLAVALTLGLPFRSRVLQLSALAMAGAAVFMTFSKTGMSCMVVVLAWHLVRGAKGIRLVMLPFGALIAILFIQDPDSILRPIADSPLLELDEDQKGRILAVGEILGGQIDERTSTGRTYLWELLIERVWENFPFGTGLGSAHHIIGGLLELDVWQGAHNTFLMVWGESGALPLLLLVAAMAAAVLGSVRYARGSIELICLFVLLMNMMAGHTALATRYHNAMLAVVLGLLTGTFPRWIKAVHLSRLDSIYTTATTRQMR